jgi:hypothetical protein
MELEITMKHCVIYWGDVETTDVIPVSGLTPGDHHHLVIDDDGAYGLAYYTCTQTPEEVFLDYGGKFKDLNAQGDVEPGIIRIDRDGVVAWRGPKAKTFSTYTNTVVHWVGAATEVETDDTEN